MINRILMAKRTALVGLGLLSMACPVNAQSYVPRIAYQQDLGTGKGNAAASGKVQAEELPAKAVEPAAN